MHIPYRKTRAAAPGTAKRITSMLDNNITRDGFNTEPENSSNKSLDSDSPEIKYRRKQKARVFSSLLALFSVSLLIMCAERLLVMSSNYNEGQGFIVVSTNNNDGLVVPQTNKRQEQTTKAMSATKSEVRKVADNDRRATPTQDEGTREVADCVSEKERRHNLGKYLDPRKTKDTCKYS